MIRLRKPSGEVTTPEGFRFLEVLSKDGKLAAVVWVDDGDVTRVAKPGDRDFERYCKAFGIEPAKMINLDKFTPED